MSSKLKMAVIGLGLIGGSFVKTATKYGYECLGYDINEESVAKALSDKVIVDRWSKDKHADLYIIALYESDTIKYVQDNICNFAKGSTIIDICGNKRGVCNALTDICKKNGVSFVGAHPMQGRTTAGYLNSSSTMFDGASMILCTENDTDEKAVKLVSEFALSINFNKVVVCTPEVHDSMLSYTSQLAHILSGSYIQNEKSQNHTGYSAGSFRDLSRVAELSADMWSELMLNNKDNLISDIECFERTLNAFKVSLQQGDYEALHRLLSDGNIMKINSKKGDC